MRVEETNTFLKTYTHSCEGSRREPVAIYKRLASPTRFANLWFANRDWLRQLILQPNGLENEIASLLCSSQ